ncbi:MAG: hypothetical protein HOQ07_11615 [Sinomonas sp.]|nr:hypothetical protein [Sinomonas sp.]
MRHCSEGGVCGDDTGSAVVEFVLLGTLLLVPIVYFVLTVGVIQGASFAAAGAADHAAKAFVSSPDAGAARRAADSAVEVSMADFGMDSATWAVTIACDRSDCLEAGAAVTVAVSVKVPLPMVPSRGTAPTALGTVSAHATQMVGRFR